MAVIHETYELNCGISIPKIGLGTWLIDDDVVDMAIVVQDLHGLLLVMSFQHG